MGKASSINTKRICQERSHFDGLTSKVVSSGNKLHDMTPIVSDFAFLTFMEKVLKN